MAGKKSQIQIIDTVPRGGLVTGTSFLWRGDAIQFLKNLPHSPLFDLVVTSPPYNIGKPYEQKVELDEYKATQKKVIHEIVKRLKPTGSLCWQVGSYVSNGGASKGTVYPLDYVFHPMFEHEGLKLRNRIVWRFGHGLHCKYRFSGRHEVVLWYTKSEEYSFDLDAVRIPSKYPGKLAYRGPNKGKPSSNRKGKNPEDVWDIPNVKSNHPEKTKHPCQFPVGLAERLILALSPENGLVFDPYSGVASTGIAALLHKRSFWGCETIAGYLNSGLRRLRKTERGEIQYRPHNKPIYDHTKSRLSIPPPENAS